MTGIFQQAIPEILDTLMAIGGNLARERVRAAVMKAATPRPMVQEGDSPPARHGCPYCAVTRNLAIAHRYLTRGTKRVVTWGAVYQELALSELPEASQTLLALTASDLDTLRLPHDVMEFEVRLSSPLTTAAEFDQAATHAWAVSETAIALAERHQAALQEQENLASQVERAAEDLARASTVIEAEARVID